MFDYPNILRLKIGNFGQKNIVFQYHNIFKEAVFTFFVILIDGGQLIFLCMQRFFSSFCISC